MEDLDQKVSSLSWNFQPLVPPNLPPLLLSLGALPAMPVDALFKNLASFQAAWPSLSGGLSLQPALVMPKLLAPTLGFAASLQLIKAGLGIDLTLPGSEELFGQVAKSVALNFPGMSLRFRPNSLLGMLLDLLPIANIIQTVQGFTNQMITSAQFPIALAQGLTLMGTIKLPIFSLQMQIALKLALVIQQLKLAFGLDLLDPAGAAFIQTRLTAMSRIVWPSLNISFPNMTLLLGLISAGKTIQLALGINPWEPGAGLKIQLALTPFLALKLPTIDLSGLTADLAALGMIAKLNPMEVAQLNLDTLNATLGSIPNKFAPWGLLAAIALNARLAFGIQLLKPATLDCKAVCPMA